MASASAWRRLSRLHMPSCRSSWVLVVGIVVLWLSSAALSNWSGVAAWTVAMVLLLLGEAQQRVAQRWQDIAMESMRHVEDSDRRLAEAVRICTRLATRLDQESRRRG